MEPCSYNCSNLDVCYHRNKSISLKSTKGVLPINFREQMLSQGYIIHESKCTPLTIWHENLLKMYPNYHITIPYQLFEQSKIIIPIKQVQITIYTKEQALKILNYQKLFLIKNNQTLQYVINEGLWNTPYSHMHFCIDQNWITKKKLQEIFYYRMLSNSSNISIDSCADSWITNGRCPYSNGSYIDITYDNTLRTCPFNKIGIPISKIYNGNYESLFVTQCLPEQCTYSNLFTILRK